LQGLLVMRFLLVSNGLVLLCIGLIAAAFGSHPVGYFVGGGFGAAALVLWLLIPLTDPYRDERSRHRSTW
jgi:hypothetical protein